MDMKKKGRQLMSKEKLTVKGVTDFIFAETVIYKEAQSKLRDLLKQIQGEIIFYNRNSYVGETIISSEIYTSRINQVFSKYLNEKQ